MHILASHLSLSGLDKAGTFSGLASDPTMNRNRWSYSPSAFAASLERHRQRGSMPALLMFHDKNRPAGAWTSIKPSANGLAVEGKLNLDTQDGREAYAHLRDKSIQALSTGCIHLKTALAKPGPGEVITEADLLEISLVAVPANGNCLVTRVSTIASVRDIEEILREGNIPGRKAKAAANAAWRAIQSAADPSADNLQSILQSASAKLARFHRSEDK